jgi:DnaJ-class molecular chaperone
MSKAKKLASIPISKETTCKLCKGLGIFEECECEDCDGKGWIKVGSDIHAQQLKLSRNKRRK